MLDQIQRAKDFWVKVEKIAVLAHIIQNTNLSQAILFHGLDHVEGVCYKMLVFFLINYFVLNSLSQYDASFLKLSPKR